MHLFKQEREDNRFGGTGVKVLLKALIPEMEKLFKKGELNGQDYGYTGTPGNIIRNKKLSAKEAIEETMGVLKELKDYWKLMERADSSYANFEFQKTIKILKKALEVYERLTLRLGVLDAHYSWL